MHLEGGETVSFESRQLLCTIPFPVLKDLELIGFSDEKKKAIEGLGSDYASATKVMFSYEKRFWEKQGICKSGRSISDELILQTYYPFPDEAAPAYDDIAATAEEAEPDSGLFSTYVGDHPALVAARASLLADAADCKSEKPGVLIGSYTNSELSEEFCGMSKAEALLKTIEQVRNVHNDQTIPQPDEANSDFWCWDHNTWSKGALAITRPNTLTRFLANAKKREGHVFFAGEHVSIAPGWIQGSLESTLREVAAMLRVSEDEPAEA